MHSIDRYLYCEDGKYSAFDKNTAPSFFANLVEKPTGRKYIWDHDIYHEVGSAANISRFEQFMCRVKGILDYIRFGSMPESNFKSFSEAIQSLFKPFDPTHLKIYKRVQRPLREIAEQYKELHKNSRMKHLLIPHPLIREGLTMSMYGLSLIAERLKKKSNLANFVVCDSLHTFQSHLQAINIDASDSRHAFVVPCHQTEINSDPLAIVEQHMVSVLVEKINGRMHVCVLEPLVIDRLNIRRADINNKYFDPESLVMAYIKAAALPKDMMLYHTIVRRQYGINGGCSTFALRDCVNFLKNPNFFNEIRLQNKKNRLPWAFVNVIEALPPAFMLSTQSSEAIVLYIKQHPAFAAQKLGKRRLTLQEAVARRSYKWLEGNPKLYNKYNDERTAKYQEMLLGILAAQSCHTNPDPRIQESKKSPLSQ